MGIPDFKIDRGQPSNVADTRASEARRVPPKKNFDEALDQVDEKRATGEEGAASLEKKKKTTASTTKKAAPEADEMKGLFSLIKKVTPDDPEAEFADDSVESPESSDDEESDPSAIGSNDLPNLKNPISKVKRDSSFEGDQNEEIVEVNPKDTKKVTVSDQASNFTVTQAQAPALSPSQDLLVAHTEYKGSQLDKVSLQALIDQVAKAAQVVTTGDKTETSIELKGKFEGARVTITEFASAKGEVNISIDNLTQEGQNLINANKSQLVDNLWRYHSVNVHIFSASTVIDTAKSEFSESGGGRKEQQGSLFQDNKGSKENKR